MSAGFFYRTYVRMSGRSRILRLSVTPLGMFTISLCLISGLAGINIFVSELYTLFSVTLSLIIISYAGKRIRPPDLTGISLKIQSSGEYSAGRLCRYTVIAENTGTCDPGEIELVPVIEPQIPEPGEFTGMKEPFEDKRNFWDRNIYYYRWIWHIFRIRKADFHALRIKEPVPGAYIRSEAGFTAVKRGLVYLKGFYIVSKNTAGLFSTYRFVPAEHTFRIYPARTPLSRDIPGKLRLDIEKRARQTHHTLKKYRTGDFVGLRDYAPGDPLRSIHWKTWAKRNRPAVVEKGVEEIKEIAFILFNVKAGPDGDIKLENCISMLYSTALKFSEADYIVTLNFFGRDGTVSTVSGDMESGNIYKVWNVLTGIEAIDINILKKGALSSSDLNTSNAVMFTPASEYVAGYCREHGIPVFSADAGTASAKNHYAVPEINAENYRIELP